MIANLKNTEKNKSVSFFYQVKANYFSIIRLMLKEIKLNVIVESFIFLVHLFQLLSFPFHPCVIFIVFNHYFSSLGSGGMIK